MALKDVLIAPVPKKRLNIVDKILKDLDENDSLYLNACLLDSSFSSVYIASKLTEAGYPISDMSIQRYRQKMAK